MNRRKFIETSGAAAGAAVLGGVNKTFDEQPSGSKLLQGEKSEIKLGLYSISYGGIWYAGPFMFHLLVDQKVERLIKRPLISTGSRDFRIFK